MRALRYLTLLGALLALGAGCGDSGGGLDTGLPPDAVIGELSQEELQQACRSLESYAQDQLTLERQARLNCVGDAALAAQLEGVDACKTVMDECIADFLAGEPPAPLDFSCDTVTTDGTSTCTATVGDAENCGEAAADMAVLAEDLTTCEMLADLEALAAAQEDLDARTAEVEAICEPLQAEGCGFTSSGM